MARICGRSFSYPFKPEGDIVLYGRTSQFFRFPHHHGVGYIGDLFDFTGRAIVRKCRIGSDGGSNESIFGLAYSSTQIESDIWGDVD